MTRTRSTVSATFAIERASSTSIDTATPSIRLIERAVKALGTGIASAVNLLDVEAIVIHSDLERTGTFDCSDPLLNRLHENVVWGLRGNFVSVPTDCPQRDERMGWTGDINAYAPTAAFLYDVRGVVTQKTLARTAAGAAQNFGVQVIDSGSTVSVVDGTLTLTGTVDRYSIKLAAEKAAQRVDSVRAVANDIAVRPAAEGEAEPESPEAAAAGFLDADAGAALIEAAHHGINPLAQLLTDFDYEPLRATRPDLDISVHEGLVHLRGRVQVLSPLREHPRPRPPREIEVRDGQVYRWVR